jgi:hypothetical protein
MRYFRDSTLVAVLPDGTWIKIEHRNDVARLRKEHPEWDGTVLCAKEHLGSIQEMRELLMDNPANIERWNIDPRVIEGRRPDGAQFPLHRLHWSDPEAVGGAKQIVESALPGCNKTLRRVAEELIQEHGERAAFRLSVVAALRGVIPDEELATMLKSWSPYETHNWAPVDVERFRVSFLRGTEGHPERRRVLVQNLLNGQSLSNSELSAILENSTGHIDEATQRLMLKRGDDVLEGLVSFENLLPEVQLAIIQQAQTRFGSNRLLKSGRVDREVLDVCMADPEIRPMVLKQMKLDDAVFETFMQQIEALDPTGPTGIGASRSALMMLAVNPSLTPEMQIRIAGLEGGTGASDLSSNPSCCHEVQRMMLETAHAAKNSDNTKWMTDQIMENLCRMKDLDMTVAVELARDGDAHTREALSRRDDLSEDVIRVALQTFTAEEKQRVLKNLYTREGTPSVDLEREIFMQSGDVNQAWIVALHTQSRELQLEIVRQAIAASTTDQSVGAIEGLISNDTVFPEVAELLTRSDDPDVRRKVLWSGSNPALSEAVSIERRLEIARNDSSSSVRAAACKLPEPGREIEQLVFHDQAFRTGLDEGALRELEMVFLYSSKLSVELQQHIAAHGTPSQQRDLAHSYRDLDDDAVRTLARLDDEDMSFRLLQRDTLPVDVVEEFRVGSASLRAAVSERDERVRYDEERRREEESWQERTPPPALYSSSSNGGRTPESETQDVLRRGREELRTMDDIHHVTNEMQNYDVRGIHNPLEEVVCNSAVMRDWQEERDHMIVTTQVNHVRDLPGFGAIPFRGIETAMQAINGFEVRTVSPEALDARGTAPSTGSEPESVTLQARVLDSSQTIDQNAEYMGNCTGGYTSRVARGDTRLVGMYDEEGLCRLNVELSYDDFRGRWVPGEINTRFNGYGYGYDATPEPMQQIADELAELLNSNDPRVATLGRDRFTEPRAALRAPFMWPRRR